MAKAPGDSLQNIMKGSMIVFFGIIISLVLNFLIRVLLVRYTTQDQYGIYTLAITVTGMISGVAILGMDEGSSRYIAYFLGKADNTQVKNTIYASIKIALLSGILFTVLAFLLSDTISTGIFHSPELSGILKIVLWTVPCIILIGILISIMRGFSNPRVKVLFNDLLRPMSYLSFLVVILLFNLPFDAIVYAYLLSFGVTLVVFLVYLRRLNSGQSSMFRRGDNSMTGDLLRFSLPLLSVNMLLMMMSQATTLILGFYKTPDLVGEFDIVLMMASLMLTVVNSLGYIYTPIVSGLFGSDNLAELKRSYVTTTKWGYLCTLPIFFLFVLFPQPILNLLFGARYEGIAFVLQIMAIGYIINPLTGPNYHTLISIGKTRYIIQSFLVNAALNLVFSILLIPTLGIAGAALSVTLSAAIANILLSVRLYQVLKIHPLTRSYVTSIGVSFGLLVLACLTMNYLALMPSIFLGIAGLTAYLIGYLALMVLLKAVDAEDVMILEMIEKRIGVNLQFMHRNTVK
jgi:O-antigen/teichoic acid export membrane protein